MKNLRNILFAAFIMVVPFSGTSQDTIRGLDQYLELAAQNNPAVKSAFDGYLAAMEKVPQAGSLPDPTATFGYFVKPLEQLGGNQRVNIEAMQMFPWFGTLKTAKDEASQMARAKYEAFNSVKADLFYNVQSAYYQLMKYDREISLVTENIDLLESLEKMALVKFQAPPGGGSSSPMMGNPPGLQNVLRVRMEILDQRDKLALLTDQRKTQEQKFNALLNRDLAIPVTISDSLVQVALPVDLTGVADSILNNNPELKMLQKEQASYASMERNARKMGLPMMGVGLNYMIMQKREGLEPGMNGKDMIMPMVSVSIPIYRKKYTAMQNEARLMQESVNLKEEDTRNDLMVNYRQFVQDLADAGRRIELYKEQEDLARKTTDLLLAGFTTTGNDYEEVLRMQLRVLDYSFRHVEAIVDYNTSVAYAEKLMNSIEL